MQELVIPNDVNNKIKNIVQSNGVKKKRKNHSQLGADFIAPDGGYGWLICMAAGASNLCTFPVLQQFGLLFRDRLMSLGISSSKVTTIINLNQALTSLIGLTNGPVFKRFTFRQVSFYGAVIAVIGILLTSYSDSFGKFLFTFSLYGCGVGLATSANSLALNTYFKEKRRIVMGISWSFTALGPIFFPLLVTFLIPRYGVQGTVLIFGGIAMNAIWCALLLQPVQWHTKNSKKMNIEKGQLIEKQPEIECKYCQSRKKRKYSIMSSQYLHKNDDRFATGYEIIDPGTPMLARANDGWFSSSSAKRSVYGSKISLASRKIGEYDSRKASCQNLSLSNRPSIPNIGIIMPTEIKRDKRAKEILKKEVIDECPSEDCPSHKSPQDLLRVESTASIKPKYLNIESNGVYKTSPTTPITNGPPLNFKQISESKYLKDNHSNRSIRSTKDQPFRRRTNTFNIENEVLDVACNKLEKYIHDESEKLMKCTCEELRQANARDIEFQKEIEAAADDYVEMKFTFWQKVSIFFDLDLLKDFTYTNIMIGITIANFSEINFSTLTPFVLSDYGLEKSEIAICMSLLGATDIAVRFFIPFMAGRIGWENRSFFLFGVLGMAMGRVVLAHFHTFHTSIAVACWIGFNKGLRTVFMALCIPSHVPLDRLPSATGLHLLFSGLFFIFMGPVVGFIRDHSNYTVTLHCLNITTYICAISWGLEKYYFDRKERKLNEAQQSLTEFE